MIFEMENVQKSNQHISRTLITLAKFWMSFPVSYLIYAAFLLGLKISDFMKIILSPFYWTISIVAVAAGYGLLRIKWYGWYLFIFSNLLIFYETASILTYYSNATLKFVAFLATISIQGLILFLVAREVRVPYFFPKIRWWESDPRYKLSVQARVKKQDGTDIDGEILDISMGGCFIKSHAYFAQEEDVVLDFKLFERPLQVQGKIVWKTESRVTHPKGIGVKFSPLNKDQMYVLKYATKKLHQLSRVYSELTHEKNWEEYLTREKRFQGKPEKN